MSALRLIAIERIPLTHVLSCEAVSGGRGREEGRVDVALNSLLRASLSCLRHEER